MSDARIQVSSQTTAAHALPLLHPSRLAAALDERVTTETVRKLQNCRRLHGRLASQMQPLLLRQGLWPIPGTEFFATSTHPREMARLAGVVWHAASLRLVLTGKAASELVAIIGETSFTFGLRHAAAAVAPARTGTSSELAEAIDRDGLACLGAWLKAATKPRRDAFLLQLSSKDMAQARRFNAEHEAACHPVMVIVSTGDAG